MIHERTLMPIVDDFALHPITDKGAMYAAANGLVTGVDVMMNQPAAVPVIRTMQHAFPKVSLGVHVNRSPGEAQTYQNGEDLAFRSSPTEEGLDQLARQTADQIKRFQDATGENPHHVGTHNHVHTDPTTWRIFPQFIDAVHEAVGSDTATLIRGVDTEQVRHCRVTTLKQGEPPLSPDEFEKMLVQKCSVAKPLDLLVHPALPPYTDDFHAVSDYRPDLREQDLAGLERIINSDAVQNAGYRLVSPTEWLAIRDSGWPESMWPIGPTLLLSIPEALRPTKNQMKDIKYPWQLLAFLQQQLYEKVKDPRGQQDVDIHPTAYIDERHGPVWFGKGVEVGFNAHIVGPAVIGDRTRIYDNCLVSGSIIGDDGLMGMGSEVVRSAVGNNYSAHSAKFLDSIGGDGLHFAGNAETANQRIDKGPVPVHVDGEKMDTGLSKYGVAMGSYSTLGPQSVTNPGTLVGRETIVGALTEVRQNVGDTMLLTNGQEPKPRQRLISQNN